MELLWSVEVDWDRCLAGYSPLVSKPSYKTGIYSYAACTEMSWLADEVHTQVVPVVIHLQ